MEEKVEKKIEYKCLSCIFYIKKDEDEWDLKSHCAHGWWDSDWIEMYPAEEGDNYEDCKDYEKR